MKNLSKEEIDFYIKNPLDFELEKQAGSKIIVDLLVEYDQKHLLISIIPKFQRLWDIAQSYWVIPEYKDYMRIVNESFQDTAV